MTIASTLPRVSHHEKLPHGFTEITRIKDGEALLVFAKFQKWLILLKPDDFLEYSVAQFDLPLGFLTWFPTALEAFRSPPSEGGLPAGKMASLPQTIEGEELSIMRAMGDRAWPEKGPPPGYYVKNSSRLEHDFDEEPDLKRLQRMKFSEEFLYEGGLLDLIKRLGDRYKAGTL